MGLSGAAAGSAKALEEILAERFEAEKLRALIAEREQQGQLDRERFEFTKREREQERADRDAEKKAASEGAANAADTERRAWQNIAGVANMPGLDPQQAQKEAAFSMRDPKLMMEALKPPKVERDPIADFEAEEKIRARYRQPQRPDRDPIADHEAKLKLDQKYKQGGEQSPYAQERSARTVQSVDELMGKISGKTTGWGNLAAGIPASDAMNFASELDTLKANIAFNELTAMREASKTGGALGQVSNVELRLLESALGALNPRQSPENLRAQLSKIKESIQRWQSAGGQPPMTPATSREGGAPSAGPAPRRMRFDSKGNPIP